MAIQIQIIASIKGVHASAFISVDHIRWVPMNVGDEVSQDANPHDLHRLSIAGPSGSFVFVPEGPRRVSWWGRLFQ